MKPRILIVEDKAENRAVAKKCYELREEYDFAYASDYDEAINNLEGTSYTGIITDCFMPKKTGSGDITLGLSLIDRLVVTPPEILDRREKYLQQLQQYKDVLDIDNPQLRCAFYINSNNSFLQAIMGCIYTKNKSPKENTRSYLEKFGVGSYRGERDPWGAAEKDHAWILEQMMQQTEAAQPLGILIIDYAQANNIPHFMLTARHNFIGENVIGKWCRENKIPFGNPTESEKIYPHYWSESLKDIERQIQEKEKLSREEMMEKLEEHYKYLSQLYGRNKADMGDY